MSATVCRNACSISGNGNELNLLKLARKNSWNHTKATYFWQIYAIWNHCAPLQHTNKVKNHEMMPMDFEWVLPCILAGSICRFSHAIGVILTFPQTQQQDDLLWRKFAWSLPQSKMWFGLILVFFRPRQTLANLTRFWLNEKLSSLPFGEVWLSDKKVSLANFAWSLR